MRASRIVSTLAFVVLAASARADVTGTWSGTMNATVACDSGSTLTISGPVSLSIIDFQGDFFGIGSVTGPDPNSETCQLGPATDVPFELIGSVDGQAMTGLLILPSGDLFDLMGTISGETMSITGDDGAGSTLTTTLTRSSTAQPDIHLTGNYAGSYTYSLDKTGQCMNVGRVDAGGATEASVVHVGGGMEIAFEAPGLKAVVPNGDGTCTVIDDTGGFFVFANINGNNLTGFITTFLEKQVPFTGSISGTAISGSGTQAGQSFTFSLTQTGGPVPPMITSFTANPATITAGQSSTLSWTTHDADSVSIDNGVGAQPANGSVVVRPATTTTYTLTATGVGGTTRGTVTITVNAAAPRVVIGTLPRGMVQAAGQGGGTDTFTLSNIGDAAANVTLAPSGDFFTIAPASFSIPAGQSQTVTITGLAKPAGSYDGTITATGTGVQSNTTIPVRLLSAAAPSGSVQPQSTTARVEVSSAAGQNASGSVDFTNSGTAALVGIAVADVPWIIPQGGVITIPPGQTVAVTYQIDSSKRPDSADPLGAVTGKISLVYIGGSAGTPSILADTPASSTISVTLVHVAKPSVGPATPPVLAPGELALFVPGLGNRATATGDLLLANKLTTPLSSLQLFMQGSGSQPLSSTISQLVANSSVTFTGVLKNVFSTSATSGTAQLRGADASRASVAAIQSNTSSPVGTYSTALPVFRSDRSGAPSASVLLTGLQKTSNALTDLFVQETSGVAGSFRIDFLDSAGRVVFSRPADTLSAFGFAELGDSVPANAVSARITNTSTGGRLAAYALVKNPTTNDGWLVTDAGTATDTTFIVPIFSAGTGAQNVLYTSNRSTAQANITVDVRSAGSSRRRAVSHRGGAASLAPESDAVTTTLAPSETTATPLAATAGYVRISGPQGAVSAAARTVRSSGASAFGSGLPAVPASLALANGESKRFAGVEDASTASRNGRVPATFRTDLALVETANQSAVVRVTLQFAFSGGSLVSSTARVTKDYPLGAGQYVLVSNLARTVVGTNRESFGDLRNMVLDVEVVSGSGRVLPFVASIDNGSGDMIVRTE